MRTGKILGGLLVAALLGTGTGWYLWQRAGDAGQATGTISRVAISAEPAPAPPRTVQAQTDPAASALGDEQNNIEIYSAVSPAVANITSTTIQYDFFFNVFPSQGSGSGFLIDKDGNIVTNYHVVSGARSVEVTLADQSRYPAKLVGRDPQTDLAVIKIDAGKPLPFVQLGASDPLRVGQKVLAIGNPFGLEGTLTTGIISSLGRSIRDERNRVLDDLIQTDAAINPGNSGGPLLNRRGEVIGINTAIYGQTNIGIGFAIPINTAKAIISDLLTDGRVRRAYLGLIGQEISPPLAELLNLPASQGLLVAQLTRDGPAVQSGIQPGRQRVLIGNQEVIIGGDLLVEVDGTPLTSSSDLNSFLAGKRPGDEVRLVLFRGNERMTLNVKLGERPTTN